MPELLADEQSTHFWEITGGVSLHGDVTPGGAKNAVTKQLVASLLTPEPCVLSNIPRINEVDVILGMLREIGTQVEWLDEDTLRVCTPEITSSVVSEQYSGVNRIPILFIGPLLNRVGEASVPLVGGCRIGDRPVDFHVDGLEAMGADIEFSDTSFLARSERLVGCHHRLPYPSVGATENLVLAAVTAKGTTVIENAAIEPEVVDLILFLQQMGAVILVDVDRRIIVEGVDAMHGATHRVLPDRIEIASFAAAAVATGGDITINGARQDHLITFLNMIRHVGGAFEVGPDAIRFFATGRKLTGYNVETDVHPGFMTDWQQPLVVLLTQADGPSVIHETVYENRLGYTEALQAMGANITLSNQCLGSRSCRFAARDFKHSAVVIGPTPLQAAPLAIPDLRAGFAYVMAALLASGTSTIHNVHYIERGYAGMPDKLRALGTHVEVH
ncbi:MAG: UDP-N-acetylglucosamine 1-carboxyvinyltransferase [Actinobacteria bacterium]|nr:UDP-N-acetylglucosamine 1-carboxyvinyltransferase [Actinomycetota bacterium]